MNDKEKIEAINKIYHDKLCYYDPDLFDIAIRDDVVDALDAIGEILESKA